MVQSAIEDFMEWFNLIRNTKDNSGVNLFIHGYRWHIQLCWNMQRWKCSNFRGKLPDYSTFVLVRNSRFVRSAMLYDRICTVLAFCWTIFAS
jgi:hypothetical protein